MSARHILNGSLVEFVAGEKNALQTSIRRPVYWSIGPGDLDGHVCTVVTLGVGDDRVEIKIQSGSRRSEEWDQVSIACQDFKLRYR